jgi:tripeptidyl-peptidase-1
VKQSGIDDLVVRLTEISDPHHNDYGQHLSREQVHAHLAPSPESLSHVYAWLEDHGVDRVAARLSAAQDLVRIAVPVHQAERLLDTTFHVFEHEDGSRVVATDRYSLPAFVHEHVDLVQPTTYLQRLKAMRKTIRIDADVVGNEFAVDGVPSADPANQTYVTSDQLRKYYKTYGYTVGLP